MIHRYNFPNLSIKFCLHSPDRDLFSYHTNRDSLFFSFYSPDRFICQSVCQKSDSVKIRGVSSVQVKLISFKNMPHQPQVKSVRFTTPVYPVRDLSGYLRHSDSFSLKMDNLDRVKFSQQSSPLKYSVIGLGKILIFLTEN